MQIIDFMFHCDIYIDKFISSYGQAVYLILFAVVFCETGLVFFPFLPGDSLIFAAGAFAGAGRLNIWLLLCLLIAASILGDTLNFEVGKNFGRRILDYEKVKLVRDEHLHKANIFVKRHGGKAVLFAKFTPIIRTIVPFLVGIGKLELKRFIRADAVGGILWVSIFLGIGFYFGNLDIVKNNFSIIIFGIIFVSILPLIISYIKSSFGRKKTNE